MSQAPRGGRLERGGGQGVVEVRFVEADHPQTGRGRIGTQPAEREFVTGSEYHEGVGTLVPPGDEIRVGEREVERRVCCLTGLGPRWKVGAGDQVQARDRTLTVRHARSVPHRRNGIGRHEYRVTKPRARKMRSIQIT